MLNLINETETIDITSVDTSIKENHLTMYIPIVNLSHFVTPIGAANADFLVNAKTSNTLTPDEEELVDLFEKAVAFTVLSMSIPNMHYKVRNSGVSKYTDDYVEPTSNSDVEYMKNQYAQVGNLWLQQALDYSREKKEQLVNLNLDSVCQDETDYLNDNYFYFPKRVYGKYNSYRKYENRREYND